MVIKFKKLHPDAIIPAYQTDGSAGFDLHALEFTRLNSDRGIVMVRTGLAVELPAPVDVKLYGSDFLESLGCASERQTIHYELQIRPRSGLSKKGIIIVNSPGTIDSDYRGEIQIMMRLLHGDRREQQPDRREIEKGDRIAQGIVNMIVKPTITEVESLSETVRGENGFGSTGR